MEDISIFSGLALTIVSMIVVFAVLAAIWGLIELVAHFTKKPTQAQPQSTPSQPKPPVPNPNHQQAVEMMALILASENQPDKKFEIVKTKRIK